MICEKKVNLKEKQYILTIAIPTFNRAEILKETLEEVLKITKGKNIEIVVSDNCSEDDTEKYMMHMVNKFPEIRYYRNAENLGPDRNFLNCFEKAKGEYVLLLGDDDLLLENGLDSLLDALKIKPVFVHLNTSGIKMNADGKKVAGEPRCKDIGTKIYTNRNDLLKKMNIYITFLSSLVFKTEYVKMLKDKEKYIGTYFLQSHIALKTMEHNGKYIFITENCCAAGGNHTVSYDLYHVWGKQYGDLMMKTAIECGFDSDNVNKIVHDAYAGEILSFVKYFRTTCVNQKNWERKDMWEYVKLFPDLVNKYKIAMWCPVFFIKAKKIITSYISGK